MRRVGVAAVARPRMLRGVLAARSRAPGGWGRRARARRPQPPGARDRAARTPRSIRGLATAATPTRRIERKDYRVTTINRDRYRSPAEWWPSPGIDVADFY